MKLTKNDYVWFPKVKSNFCVDFVILIEAVDDNLNYFAASAILSYLSLTTFADGLFVSLAILMYVLPLSGKSRITKS